MPRHEPTARRVVSKVRVSAAAEGGASSLPRIGLFLLPSDLDGALRALDDEAFDKLNLAVGREAKRRSTSSDQPRPVAESDAAVRRRAVPARARATELPVGKIHMIKAAAAAGLTPTMIARQIGIPLAAVRAVLAGKA